MPVKKLIIPFILCALLDIDGVSAPPTAPEAGVSGQKAGLTLEWHGTNREKLEQFILTHGKSGSRYNPAKKPVAVFDWDNTVIKNDVYQATLFWLLNNNLIKNVPDWKQTSPYFTATALAELEKNCPRGQNGTIETGSNSACADTIVSIAEKGALSDGKTPAWNKYNPDTLMPQNAWVAGLAAGYTPEEIRDIADRAIEFNLKNPVGAVQKVGSRSYNAYMRVYGQIAELIAALKKNEFDVWVVSASPQYVVESFAGHAGIGRDRVIGVRPLLDDKKRVTYGVESCGPDSGDLPVITYRQGKRCWINKVIFGEKDPKAMLEKPSPTVFAAGDSDTDAFFVKDATGMKLVINRNTPEIMCNAYANTGRNWTINPMFIAPLPQRSEDYRCAGFGLPDQEDTVFRK